MQKLRLHFKSPEQDSVPDPQGIIVLEFEKYSSISFLYQAWDRRNLWESPYSLVYLDLLTICHSNCLPRICLVNGTQGSFPWGPSTPVCSSPAAISSFKSQELISSLDRTLPSSYYSPWSFYVFSFRFTKTLPDSGAEEPKTS